jgi:hypothetical protein
MVKIIKTFNIYMNIIILIIDDDSHPCYSLNRNIWNKLINILRGKVKIFFIRLDTKYQNTTIEDNTIYINGNESFIPGILHKTIEAMRYCLENFSVDYFFRTNISSFIHYDNLCYKILELQNQHGIDFVSAIIGECRINIEGFSEPQQVYFPSGSGFIMSANIAKNMTNGLLDYTLIDDVAIGVYLKLQNISIILGNRIDFSQHRIFSYETIMKHLYKIKTNYHYRLKMPYNKSRDLEHQLMNNLLEMLY